MSDSDEEEEKSESSDSDEDDETSGSTDSEDDDDEVKTLFSIKTISREAPPPQHGNTLHLGRITGSPGNFLNSRRNS